MALNPPSSTVSSKNAWALYFVAVALLVSCNGGASTTTETKLWTMTSRNAVQCCHREDRAISPECQVEG
ncbi:hypothetical protein JG688_00016991 [Phytophthora aleatoria]|uniref:RxLR effector protein n=1 Tax=Phytophthora aleatoria TaxID=2496075 RepID=A0A8J5ID81_9STRA|nr:hypothetical protein JG688_00016991 [Phytophthora aleatoria]